MMLRAGIFAADHDSVSRDCGEDCRHPHRGAGAPRCRLVHHVAGYTLADASREGTLCLCSSQNVGEAQTRKSLRFSSKVPP